ncbi:hypothetical protein M8J77_012469 [Diaphorina citri]|nr:hypothetical protein M8J77_012469 [Diaphorina citri]
MIAEHNNAPQMGDTHDGKDKQNKNIVGTYLMELAVASARSSAHSNGSTAHQYTTHTRHYKSSRRVAWLPYDPK